MNKSYVFLAFCFLFSTAPLLAEVSTNSPLGTLVLGAITDDPNPVGIWAQYRPVAPNQILNPSGDSRGDGVPSITWRENAWPIAVWSYNATTDGDVAYSEWDGSGWTNTEFLTSGSIDELDPRVFVEPDGAVHVVWWTAGATENVHLVTRPAGSAMWGDPVLVTPGMESGRRPAVAVDAGVVMVAYERDSVEAGMSQDVVVATFSAGGSSTAELVASTPRAAALYPMVHAEGGTSWVDWIHDTQGFGCVERELTGWSGLVTEPWTNNTWVGVEEMRRVIRSRVLRQ